MVSAIRSLLPSCLILVLPLTAAIPVASAQSLQGERLLFKTLQGGRFYVGQGISFQLELPESARLAVLKLPALNDGVIELEPESDRTNQAGAGTRQGLIVAKRPGMLLIPALKAQDGDRVWLSNPLRLEIRPVPVGGRSSAFQGGVGPVQLTAHWSDSRVREGESAELEIVARGAGVLGLVNSPLVPVDVNRDSARMERTSVERSLFPPVRTERFRVRAMTAGPLELEPLTCETFEPETARFVLRSWKIPTLMVTKLAAPQGEWPAPPNEVREPVWSARSIWMAVAVLGCLMLTGLWWRQRHTRTGEQEQLMAVIQKVHRLSTGVPSQVFARRVMELLAESTRGPRATGTGVLTPLEARRAWKCGPDGDQLADRAERLVIRCEAAIYRRDGVKLESEKAWNNATHAEVLAILQALWANQKSEVKV